MNTGLHLIGGLRRSVRRAVMVVAALLALASTAAAGTITIAWDANPEPAVMGYTVYVGTSAGNYTTSYDVGHATTFDFAGAVPGTTYHFVVRAYADSMTVSPLSGEITASVAAAALGTPTPLAPTGTTSVTPTFSWSAVPGATSYSLWVDDATTQGKIQQVYDATAVGCAAGTGTCAVTSTVALATGKATWWVMAAGAGGAKGPWSADSVFTVSTVTQPTAPTLLGPLGTTTSNPTFSWSAVANATAYSVWVDDASAQGKIQQVYSATQVGCAAGTGTCAVTPGVTLATGAGTWWVKATTAAGDGPWSADGAFTVAAAAATVPATPTLLGPSGKTSKTPTFSWAAVPTATSYALWVDDASQEGKIQQVYSATELGCAAGTGTCTVTPGVTLATGAGKWWVKATNAVGDGAWSAGGAFTVRKN